MTIGEITFHGSESPFTFRRNTQVAEDVILAWEFWVGCESFRLHFVLPFLTEFFEILLRLLKRGCQCKKVRCLLKAVHDLIESHIVGVGVMPNCAGLSADVVFVSHYIVSFNDGLIRTCQ